ncbi:MAG: porin [Limisphaerales bacterium]
MKNRTNQLKRLVLAGTIAATQLAGQVVWADDSRTEELIRQLQKRVEELEEKVKTLEAQRAPAGGTNGTPATPQIEQLQQKVEDMQRRQEEEARAAEERARTLPKLSIGQDGFAMRSPNGDYKLQLEGVLQVDSRTFFGNSQVVGDDAFLIRRARPILQGTVARDFDFLFVPDFAGTTPQIFDAYVNYKYSPALQLRAGKFKSPVGLEQLVLDRELVFDERALPTDLAPNRDVGFELHGELFSGRLNYGVGIFNGVGDARISNNTSFENDKSFAGRIFVEPFKPEAGSPLRNLGVGVSGSFDSQQATNTSALSATTGGSLAGFATVGQQQFFAYNPSGGAAVVANGDHWRLSPQGYYYYGPLGLLWEYVISDQGVSRTAARPFSSASLENTAWQISGGWILTGERAAYAGGVPPRRPFNPAAGGWGAWQVVARYSELDVDHNAFPLFANPASSASSAHGWEVGLNWYLNLNLKLGTSFAHTTFEGGGAGATAPGIVTRKDENVLFTRIQLAF